MELDSRLFGVTRPPPLKLEPKWRPVEDVELKDFSIYDDDVEPFVIKCDRFEYKNKAQIKLDEEIEAAMAEYDKRRRNLSPFDAIAPPAIAGLAGGIRPIDITKNRTLLTCLSKLALDDYNHKNQDSNYEFVDLVKSTRKLVTGGMYFITFKAKANDDATTNPDTIFQAQVWNKRSAPEVKSCAIKT